MIATTERCPWCDSVISRIKFEQIQAKIREQEQAKLAEVEKQLRAQLQAQHAAEVAKQRQLAETNAKAEAAKQIAAANAERDQTQKKILELQSSLDAIRKRAQADSAKLTEEFNRQRDALQQQIKDALAREAAARSSVQQQLDSALKLKLKEFESQRQKDVANLRASLEKDRDLSLLKAQADFNREREGFQKKIKEMERQLQKKTPQDLGDGAELDLYEILREAFPDDHITRVQKGQPGADIHHEVMYKGQCCGKIVIDSKNRHSWQNGFVTKLRQDQTEASAEHAILASTVFPAGKKEMCIESDVIVVSPARVKHVVSLLRRSMITVHVRGLSLTERATKMTKLYKLITSEAYRQRFDELEKLTNDILDLDVQEKKSHDNVWRKRGVLATCVNSILREIDTEVGAVIEGQDNKELSVAS